MFFVGSTYTHPFSPHSTRYGKGVGSFAPTTHDAFARTPHSKGGEVNMGSSQRLAALAVRHKKVSSTIGPRLQRETREVLETA